ncbi:acyl-CoA-binding domain-containing protein 6 isoform X2 [Sinocyclocheilus grahami]|uniref:acyl-CoA-binding domain-containing protein 6 isoform X2 n=1 Tax=Sinocyclocheilus grahami TaxID=75366 RepID=UPI0007ACE0D3|nr:PREDICTED: acyl-CoA-binding domain-containing protein 6 isoform X2 [Sinocyclocheilus grahami]
MASRSPSSSPDSATGSGTDPARPDTGEPLGGGSDSDSDFGLGKFDCSAGDAALRLEGVDLENEFEAAADRVRDLVQTASREQLLYLYARFKQVKVGKCNTPKPGFFDFEGQRKWSAWKQLGDMSAEQAMQEYVSCVCALDPEGSQKSSERRGGEMRTGFGGPAVSSLYQEEKIREEDKNIFDYCRENNIEHVSKAISSKKVDVNTRDEEGRALLHWACDRGHKDLVSLLLQNNADINSQVVPQQPCIIDRLPSKFCSGLLH